MDIDTNFLIIAHLVGMVATCDRAHHGAIAVRDNHIIASGCNHSPTGQPKCSVSSRAGGAGHVLIETVEKGKPTTHCVRTLHAEISLITAAARKGISLKGAVWYETSMPCIACANAMAVLGLSKITLVDYYAPLLAQQVIHILEHSGAKLNIVKPSDIGYQHTGISGSFQMDLEITHKPLVS